MEADEQIDYLGLYPMNAAGQTICLSMIVRNESQVIRRCLDSVRTVIDYWVIVDTGSTDSTQDIIREHLRDLKGELHERPWRDFAHNRSEALDLAKSHGDYTLIIDADDVLEIPEGYQLPELTADALVLDIQDAGIRYRRTQIVRSSLPWRYKGVLHEFLTFEGSHSSGHVPILMRRNHDGARRRDSQTYQKDAAVLERALLEETDPFLISRYTFYLAQSYRDCGEKQKALDKYLARGELGFWQEEVFVSLLYAARLKEELGQLDQEVIDAYSRASSATPKRAEALHGASRFFRLKNRFEEGYEIARQGMDIRQPDDGLFLETWIYDYGLLDELAVNAYWSGHFQNTVEACEKLLSSGKCPAGERNRIAANAEFAREKLREIAITATPGADTGPRQYPVSRWAPEHARGGTELMADGLRSRLASELRAIDLKINLFSPNELTGKPLVLWMHHNVDQRAVQWCRDKSLVSRVRAFVFVSFWQMRRYVDEFGLPPDRCVVLKNATTINRPQRRWNPGDKRRVAYVSTPVRGLDVLLDAWQRSSPERAELHIWSSMKLYGKSFDDRKYAELFERAATLPGVFFRGIIPNDQLRDELRDIDYLAYPSTFEETSCVAAIEALAVGCRVICPSLGALPETTGRFGRLYPFQPDPGDHARLFAHILSEELENPWDGHPELSEAQQQWAFSTYDWSVRVDQWRILIAQVAENRVSDRTIINLSEHNQIYDRFLSEIRASSLDESIATNHWRQRCEELKKDAQTGSKFDFLRWPSLGDFSVPELWIPPAWYNQLRSSSEWHRRWFYLTRESKVGNPQDYSNDFGSSPILIQHAYHLFRYERATHKALKDCDVIFEVGGGYGSFCRLLRNSGFSGLHVIYDLPHVSAIQRLYLSLSGFTEAPAREIGSRDRHGFSLISDSELDAVFERLESSRLRVGFVATWSLSETSMSVRKKFFPRFHGILASYLISYQFKWEGIDNINYFDDFADHRVDLDWRNEEIGEMIDINPSYYLFA
jgi:glycosyltransferase involved in cell wall biosynthesis